MSERDKRASVCVVGLGYIGLPTAVVLAKATGNVAGYEIDSVKRQIISDARAPFVENGLDKALREVLESESLTVADTLPNASCYIVAVPTPIGKDKKVDLAYLKSAVEHVSAVLQGDELIVIESTCPPGTTQQVRSWVLETRPDLSSQLEGDAIQFAYCPERVLPGNILFEITENDRIVGGLTESAAKRAKSMYESFCHGTIHLTDAITAEITKLAENTFRDINIAFANELETISRYLGADAWEVISLANHHPRVNILKPGPGVGGHCIAVDPWFLAAASENPTPMIEAARSVNDGKPKEVVERVIEALDTEATASILVLGITFKENVDDVRESPAVTVVSMLSRELPCSDILVVDPMASELPESLGGAVNVQFSQEIPHSLQIFDAVVGLVAHDAFSALEVSVFGEAAVIDTRNMF
ncbi:nucleotide sugar dehydrogenase [Corynebacterium sp. HMSC034A01]|uniref:nucleotide sugar dehydrogenase n=1 Tax=Corynebacterium sp. HMSC034A01 TaxID=1739295 RepID=UPI0008A8A496|nr:nucleotide sugar dehydrogenase [Corynebacterium sp. HMSC034A01]